MFFLLCICDRRITRQILEAENGVCKICSGSLLLNPSNSLVPDLQGTTHLGGIRFDLDGNSDHIYQVPSDVARCPIPFQRLDKFQNDFPGSGKTQRTLPLITHAQIHNAPKCPNLAAAGMCGSGSLHNSLDTGVEDVMNNMSIPTPVSKRKDENVSV